ncbi:MAG: peptide chain release factor N(5)-glutamine methyltransferase [Desulfobacteraceae bacterium]|nr:MAG: peptide chain release factor N(5)-glutamine methyltransferase [Desulfobacteraceae bacterium]
MADWTVFSILTWTTSYFKSHDIDSPRLTAEVLLAHSLGIKRLDLYLQYDKPLNPEELSEYKALIQRRKNREPVAYITGQKGFYEFDFEVAPGVLIPRPDTETLLEETLGVIDRKAHPTSWLNILELGVGSGALITSIAAARPGEGVKRHRFFASDISKTALGVAASNIRHHAPHAVHLFNGSWLDAVKRQPFFDIIVSNPPYIPTGEILSLQPEVQGFEPILALDGGNDGSDAFVRIMAAAHEVMTPSGVLLFEMGFDQKGLMTDLVKRFPCYGSCRFVKDLAGHDRVAVLEKKN